MQPEDTADDGSFGVIHRKHLLEAVPLPASVNGLVSERRAGAVPEPLARVLAHGAVGVLGVLAALVFIEHREHLPQHFRAAVMTSDVLRDRDEVDPGATKPTDIHLVHVQIPREAARAVHEHHIERSFGRRGRCDHALEGGAILVSSRCASVLEDRSDGPPARVAVCACLVELIGQREIRLGLPTRRDTQIDRDPLGALGVER
ncbi:MAG: hypothetical protein MUC89_23075 [Acetobacteraceae bacterium]|nr:hypothetical protein [Acetobacteraceae bacterium]